MSILHLTLQKQWFDRVISDQKSFEYREYKPHWMSRLLGQFGCRAFEEVRFTNGYGSHRPFIRVEFIGMAIMKGRYCKPENGEQLDDDQRYFVIALGRVLQVGNLKR